MDFGSHYKYGMVLPGRTKIPFEIKTAAACVPRASHTPCGGALRLPEQGRAGGRQNATADPPIGVSQTQQDRADDAKRQQAVGNKSPVGGARLARRPPPRSLRDIRLIAGRCCRQAPERLLRARGIY